MTSKRATKTKKRHVKKRAGKDKRTEIHSVHHPEHRERYYRAKRALRALKQAVWNPKAVIHSYRTHIPEKMLKEIPEQALIEHWEAIGELRGRGIDVRATRSQNARPHLTREIEIDNPVSYHARSFAQRHGLILRERRHPIRTTLERMFG
ncbi:MAG: hypothetical protein V1776_05340 [Candidatus Diapherotrites archaeon]